MYEEGKKIGKVIGQQVPEDKLVAGSGRGWAAGSRE